MAKPTVDDMDALIERALFSEPIRSAPLSLHRRVDERVRIAALREREQVRFRYSMATFAVGLVLALGAAALTVSITNFDQYLAYGIAGGKGQYDSYLTSINLTWSEYSGAYSLTASILMAGGALLLGLIPLRKHIWSH